MPEKLHGMVEDDGFILINDYGQAEVGKDHDFEHQRFSLATFVGVNSLLRKEYCEQRVESGSQTPFGNALLETPFREPGPTVLSTNLNFPLEYTQPARWRISVKQDAVTGVVSGKAERNLGRAVVRDEQGMPKDSVGKTGVSEPGCAMARRGVHRCHRNLVYRHAGRCGSQYFLLPRVHAK